MGVFDADTTERDLRATRVWGQSVRVRAGPDGNEHRAKVGDTGRIGAYYPVGLSCFDLGIEAPVHDLPDHPDAIIGIPWGCLELLDQPFGVSGQE